MEFGPVTAKEMHEAVKVLDAFNTQTHEAFAPLGQAKRIHIIAEGSSRHFPAGNMIFESRKLAHGPFISAEGGVDALAHTHDDAHVVLISNSGKTKEILDLEEKLRTQGHKNIFSITRDGASPLAERCANHVYVLGCGAEEAVAATKSVVEQALFLQSLLPNQFTAHDLQATANAVKQILDSTPTAKMIEQIANAETIYFVGPANGLGDELALKFSETCKKAISLSGTGVLHGPQETIKAHDVIVLLDPPRAHTTKFKQVLEDQADAHIIALAPQETPFPTIVLPQAPANLAAYTHLAAGWALLLGTANALKINIDKPKRAQKVGYQ
ncbi:MAG: SIS domain-containing protein [Alphaproteobacteria bacterium]|nr:SIS domain-containing protein [Alphaproteobacteria bacterium]